MKIVVIALIIASCITAKSQAVYNAAINQARRAVSKTEAASNQNPDAPQPGQPSGQPPPPMDPVLAATLQNISSLEADLATLVASNPSPPFTNDLMTAATGTKASADTVGKLAADLQTAVAGKSALRPSLKKMAQFLHAVSNGAHLTTPQVQMISDSLDQILDDGGASYEAKAAVLEDVKTLARETK